jgi:hypothetical protein
MNRITAPVIAQLGNAQIRVYALIGRPDMMNGRRGANPSVTGLFILADVFT